MILKIHQHQSELPWVKEKAEYDARPHCMAQRDWVRAARKTLRETLVVVDEDTEVIFSFVDGVLTIRCDDEVVAFPAEGRSWSKRYSLPAGKFNPLPKRLMREYIEVSVWRGKLTIGSWRYEGVVELKEA